MQKEVIATNRAPAAVGPYSQAIAVGHLVYTAGQVALDKNTGKLVEGGIQEQTKQALENLQAVLEAAGSSVQNVVKTTVFLHSIGDYAAMNEVYAQQFTAPFPTRATVQVSRLPRDVKVEIDVIASLA